MLNLRLLVLLIPIGMTFQAGDTDASRSPSRFCAPSERNCHLSSWLAPPENGEKDLVPVQVLQDQDDVRTSEPIVKTVTVRDSNKKLQEVAVEPRTPSAPVASSPKISPQPKNVPIGKTVAGGDSNTTLKIVTVEPRKPSPPVASEPKVSSQPKNVTTTSVDIRKPALTQIGMPPPIPISPQHENDPALKSNTPQAGHLVPTVQPLSLTGPPPFDAATGNLNVAGLNVRTGREPIDGLLTVSNGSEAFVRSSQSPLAAAPQSSWLQRVGWLDTPNITVGTRVWLTQGKFGFNFGGGSPDVLSELLWQGQNAKIYEVKADLVVRRFVSTVTLGWGHIGKGTLDDYDFAASNRTCVPAVNPISGLCSWSNSGQTDGYVLHGSVDIGPRVLQWNYKDQAGGVDLLFGYQFWREKYTARGMSDIHCRLADGTDCTSPGTAANAITETITWQSLRLGPRVTVPLPARFAVVGQVLYIPWNKFENEDIHHLREQAISQSPSFIQKAAGGNGIQVEGALQYRPWKSLLLEAGYRYWDIRSGSGDSSVVRPCTIFGQGGIRDCVWPNGQLNDAKARRQGIFFGAGWTF